MKTLPRPIAWAAACGSVALVALVCHPPMLMIQMIAGNALLMPFILRAELGINPVKSIPETIIGIAVASLLDAALLAVAHPVSHHVGW